MPHRATGLFLAILLTLPLAGRAQHGVAFAPEQLREWLTYVASDDLQGRQVFTEGLGLAAAYIAEHLQTWGVEPAGDEGTYYQTVRVLGMQTRSNSSVTVTAGGRTRTFVDGEGVTFARNQGAKRVVAGRVEFVGYGMRHTPVSHDDYAGRNMAGKIAVYIGRLAPGMTTAHNALINRRARLATDEMQARAAIGPMAQAASGRGGAAAQAQTGASAQVQPQAQGQPAAQGQPPSQRQTPEQREAPAQGDAPARADAAGRGNGAAPANAPAPQTGRGAAPAQGNAPPRVDFQTAQGVDHSQAPQITAGDDFFEFLFEGSGHTYAELQDAAARQQPLPRIDLDATIEIRVDAEYDVVQTRLTRNVVGLVRGTDADVRDTYVLLGAHYDHAGYQQFVGTVAAGPNAIASCTGQTRPTPAPGDIINNGADDNGSGTVALLALARAFAEAPPRRSILFVWHTGEEAGLYGSRYMAEHLPAPADRIAAHINLDMIGRNRCDDPAQANTVYVVGSDRISTDLHNLNEEANASLAQPLTLDYELNDPADLESLYTRSDHYSYAAKGVPVIFFTTGLHRDYHFVTDEVEKIEFLKLARVAELVHATARRLADLDRMPARDNRGPRVGTGQRGPIR